MKNINIKIVIIAFILLLTNFKGFNNMILAQEVASGVLKIACGEYHCLALMNDGTVWGWGNNKDGQIYGTNTANIPYPVCISPLSNVIDIAAARNHSLALKSDGTVWSWGFNGYGQLGDGTTTTRKSPVKINGLTDVKKISTSVCNSMALKNDGTVWVWGANSVIGDGKMISSNVPVQVVGLTDVRDISCEGANTFFVIKNDGTVWGWGNGYLGNGTKGPIYEPTKVSGLTDISKIFTGIYASNQTVLALKNSGAAYAWGLNSYGLLGDGVTTVRYVPTPITVIKNVDDIATSGTQIALIKNDGNIGIWGQNSNGQLGDGSYIDSSIPVQPSGLTDVRQIEFGEYFAVAIKNDGTVWAWGLNNYRNLGNGSNTRSNIPVQIINLNPTNFPAQPSNLLAALLNQEVLLTWDDSMNAVSYNIKRSESLEGIYETIAEGITETSYLDSNVMFGSTYYYKVSAVNNGLSSGDSEEAIIQITGIEAPANLRASSGDGRIDLEWSLISDDSTYNISRATTPGGPYTVLAMNVTGSSYTDRTVTNDTVYYYVIKAINEEGESSYSNEVSITPKKISETRALLIITFSNGIEKYYDMSEIDIASFIHWFEDPENENDYYIINETTNEGMVTQYNLGSIMSKKTYNKIDCYEVIYYVVE